MNIFRKRNFKIQFRDSEDYLTIILFYLFYFPDFVDHQPSKFLLQFNKTIDPSFMGKIKNEWMNLMNFQWAVDFWYNWHIKRLIVCMTPNKKGWNQVNNIVIIWSKALR